MSGSANTYSVLHLHELYIGFALNRWILILIAVVHLVVDNGSQD